MSAVEVLTDAADVLVFRCWWHITRHSKTKAPDEEANSTSSEPTLTNVERESGNMTDIFVNMSFHH